MDQFWNFIVNYFIELFGLNKLSSPQGIINLVCMSITTLIGVMTVYRFVYTIIGFFAKPKHYPEAPKVNKYAAIICAKDEERVILSTINSIKHQDYPSELIDIIIMADNCKDNTAKIGRENGCIVYERHDPSKARKGYGLKWLFNELKKDGSFNKYEAFFFFDADCTISLDFFSKMNDCYASGKYDSICAYRDSKNFAHNFITSAYGFSYYRFTISCHRPRTALKSGTIGAGTGWMASKKMMENGWNETTLLEDLEFVNDMTAKGYRFGFCEDAIIYIEHPTNFVISCRQRLRWSRGALQVYFRKSWKLLASFFKRPSWTKYDVYFDMFPYSFFSFMVGLVYQLSSLILFLTNTINATDYNWSSFITYMATSIAGIVVAAWFVSILITIKEWKRINCNLPKAIFYNIIWPWFDLVSIPISFMSLFINVKWKNIPHNDAKETEEIMEELNSLNK